MPELNYILLESTDPARNLAAEQIGEHSCTSYNAKGEPQRTINYAGDGTVLSGRDYNNPNLDF